MAPPTETRPPELPPLDEMVETLEAALLGSPADETAFSWLEGWSAATGRRPRADGGFTHRRQVLVRVLEGGRWGSFRSDRVSVPALRAAVRQAIAHSRTATRLPGLPHLPHEEGGVTPAVLFDPAVATLGPEEAHGRVAEADGGGVEARLRWRCDHLVVVDDRGLRRRSAATSLALEVEAGRGPGAGRALRGARTLADLPLAEAAETARARSHSGPPGEPSDLAPPAVLAPEATRELLHVLNHHALTAQAYRQGDSFLREHLGVQVFDSALELVDDGSDEGGLPFPFDLEGTPKRRIGLVEGGVPKVVAVAGIHASLLGLPPTPHAWAGDDARPEHLFLTPGTASRDEVVAAGDGGVWVGSFDRIECYDSRRLLVRARARGVRRIRTGSLAEPLPDLLWQASLLQCLGSLAAVGREVSRMPGPPGSFGGTCCPAIALTDAGAWSPWPDG